MDIIPFIGPPAWTVMVFFQVYYDLNIWPVLFIGVSGSALGRYIYSVYIPLLSSKILSEQKNEDVMFIGKKLEHSGWKVQLFVLLYTLMPLPSTPLFTAAGIARIKPLHIIPAFFVGKFTSDAIMVVSGNYLAAGIGDLTDSAIYQRSILGIVIGIAIILIFLFIDWRFLIRYKKLRLSFNIWR